jgi:outer membrane protein OmpA-like peptidoglycan-associated protein
MPRAIAIILFFVPCLAIAEQPPLSVRAQTSWLERKVSAVLSLDVEGAGIVLPAGRSAALQKLDMECPSLLKDSFLSILVDSSSRLGDLVSRGDVSLAELNRLVDGGKKSPPYFSLDLRLVSMTHEVALTDVGALLVRHRSRSPRTDRSRPYYPRLHRDRRRRPRRPRRARGVRQGPRARRTFPPALVARHDRRVRAQHGRPAVARTRGIVRYGSSADDPAFRDIVGADPLRITAREVFGQYRTDPVISREDYLRIVGNEANRRLLAEGKVVILLDPEALEGPGPGPVKDGDYYYAYETIAERIEKKRPAKVDFSDSWEGLKLTIYDIRFVADTAEILASERGRIDVIAEALALAGPYARFTVEGHTASVGKPGGELRLSVERAARIVEELAARGIDRSRFASTGFGGTRPVADNATTRAARETAASRSSSA